MNAFVWIPERSKSRVTREFRGQIQDLQLFMLRGMLSLRLASLTPYSLRKAGLPTKLEHPLFRTLPLAP